MWSAKVGSLPLTRTAPCRGSGGCAAIELADTCGENVTLEPRKDFDDLRRASARIGAEQCVELLDWDAEKYRLAFNAR